MRPCTQCFSANGVEAGLPTSRSLPIDPLSGYVRELIYKLTFDPFVLLLLLDMPQLCRELGAARCEMASSSRDEREELFCSQRLRMMYCVSIVVSNVTEKGGVGVLAHF